MTRTRGLGDYLDFESALPGYLRELVILLTARQWGQNYEWNAHYPVAIDEGFSADMAQAIAEGRRPEGMVEEEEILYDFCMELQRNHSCQRRDLREGGGPIRRAGRRRDRERHGLLHDGLDDIEHVARAAAGRRYARARAVPVSIAATAPLRR